MKMFVCFILSVFLSQRILVAYSADDFNYDKTSGNSYGPSDWDQVHCPDLKTCRREWPDAWEMAIDWELKENSWYVSIGLQWSTTNFSFNIFCHTQAFSMPKNEYQSLVPRNR